MMQQTGEIVSRLAILSGVVKLRSFQEVEYGCGNFNGEMEFTQAVMLSINLGHPTLPRPFYMTLTSEQLTLAVNNSLKNSWD